MSNQVAPKMDSQNDEIIAADSSCIPTENFDHTEDPNQPYYSSMFKQPTKQLTLDAHPDIKSKLEQLDKIFIARCQVQPENHVGFFKHFYNLKGVALKLSILDKENKKILDATEMRQVFMIVCNCFCASFPFFGTNKTHVQINVPDASASVGESSENIISNINYNACLPWDRIVNFKTKAAQFQRRWEIKDYENNVVGSIQKLAREPEGTDDAIQYSTHYSIRDCDGKMVYYIRPEIRTNELLKSKNSLKKFHIQEIKSQNTNNQNRRVSQHSVHRRMSKRITDDRFISAGEIGIFMENASFCTKLADRPIEIGLQNDVNKNDYVRFPDNCSWDKKIMILQAALMIEFEFTRRALLWGNRAFDVTSLCEDG